MARPSNRERLLRAGLRVVHERGFGAASVRDIVRAAGVPQGSFTNHWACKEAFGLDVLDAYAAAISELADRTLRAPGVPALDRMRSYVAALRDGFCGADVHCGCLLGNMSAEAGDAGDAIRLRVVDIFAGLRAGLASCLTDAVAQGELSPSTPCDRLAGTILSCLQGAILMAKAHRDAEPVEEFEALLFTAILPAHRVMPATASASHP